mmetsp:Transcript_17055/g.26623  ORF Transcript_17055/g.26623 Transcript_17055/m.26623 type:complete len:119 (+) Transcript_17055:158-514(+)|eukprot:CAMPEP_0201509244 /NCGR_PEP_ID=MMETSP0161_2-20130828/2357_1 /ASSEMBLY_ACC=CAM_ASM_000251 /TAXON_ID=180227 /ORGANISM="Neoparamoeba aestuarina, Strain SoJaBio B1-5/56/2" /LENGTH=118 /DNA_ID=CAMNT_0047904143 /DNA_START=157 /DNA_END=513 /DNA_ORIENTATION=+
MTSLLPFFARSSLFACRGLYVSSTVQVVDRRWYAKQRPYSDEVTYRLNKLTHKYEQKKKDAKLTKGYIPETLEDDYKREEAQIINQVRREYARGPSSDTKSSKEEELPEGYEYVERPF